MILSYTRNIQRYENSLMLRVFSRSPAPITFRMHVTCRALILTRRQHTDDEDNDGERHRCRFHSVSTVRLRALRENSRTSQDPRYFLPCMNSRDRRTTLRVTSPPHFALDRRPCTAPFPRITRFIGDLPQDYIASAPLRACSLPPWLCFSSPAGAGEAKGETDIPISPCAFGIRPNPAARVSCLIDLYSVPTRWL